MLIVVKRLRLDNYESLLQPSRCLFKNVIFCTINYSAKQSLFNESRFLDFSS